MISGEADTPNEETPVQIATEGNVEIDSVGKKQVEQFSLGKQGNLDNVQLSDHAPSAKSTIDKTGG